MGVTCRFSIRRCRIPKINRTTCSNRNWWNQTLSTDIHIHRALQAWAHWCVADTGRLRRGCGNSDIKEWRHAEKQTYDLI